MLCPVAGFRGPPPDAPPPLTSRHRARILGKQGRGVAATPARGRAPRGTRGVGTASIKPAIRSRNRCHAKSDSDTRSSIVPTVSPFANLRLGGLLPRLAAGASASLSVRAAASSSSACARPVSVSSRPASIRASSTTRSWLVQLPHAAAGHPAARRLVHHQVPVGEGRHLRQVGHDDHLVAARQPGQPAADLHRRPAADTGVHLVEDHRRHRIRVRQNHFERQHHPGQLAAGRALVHRQRRGPRMRRATAAPLRPHRPDRRAASACRRAAPASRPASAALGITRTSMAAACAMARPASSSVTAFASSAAAGWRAAVISSARSAS